MISFGDALKSFRANVYKHGDLWHCGVVCANDGQKRVTFKEAQQILNASSLKIFNISHSRYTIQTERGGLLRFYGPMDMMAGLNYPHIISMYTPDADGESSLRRYNRSSFIDDKDCVFHIAGL